MYDPVYYMKKFGLFTVGLYALTEEKINEYVKDLVESGEINREEGKKFVTDLIETKRKQQEEMEEKMSSRVREAVNKSDVATQEHVKNLEEKIDRLEKMLAKSLGEDTPSEKKDKHEKDDEWS
ncbi:MAG: phasin family protein [Methanohalophilus sp.]